jgi:hypothetical protein
VELVWALLIGLMVIELSIDGARDERYGLHERSPIFGHHRTVTKIGV